jgi:multidrug transporter EmrE-like cation transporter
MTALLNWIITVVAIIVGIIGLAYLLKAREKMGKKLKETGIYLAIAVVVFLVQGVGDVGFTQAMPQHAGLWAALTLLIGMIFFTVGFKKLAETFR